MFGINPVLDAVWAGIWFAAILTIALYLTGVQEDGGPMRYERWRQAFVMWNERRAARRAAGMNSVYIPVSRYGMESGGMESGAPAEPDIDAVNAGMLPFKRDITDMEWIAWMAVARGKDKKYRFSANTIHTAIGGDRNTVLATIKELRAVPPPAQFRQPDGGTAPAEYPVTKSA